MFSALHPLLLWGVAAVSVPILIHLMLRQRPRPRPWAAMRWLAAALQVAQRRYKLTNLLLLLLRCLVVALAALAVARPNLAGLGSGGRLVLAIDVTASMGPRADASGPLAETKAALAEAALPDRITVVAIGERARVMADGGRREALAALARLEALPLPGGVDRAAESAAGADLIGALAPDADVVVISDFQQDDGDLLEVALAGRCRTHTRWAVGAPSANAVVAGVLALPDLAPDRPGELLLAVEGASDEARISVDGGPATPVTLSGEGGRRRLAIPPLTPGVHRLTVELVDRGLAYDNQIELPVTVRTEIPTLAVQTTIDFLGAALAADSRNFQHGTVNPVQLPARALPAQGLVALRGAVGEGQRLAAWVQREQGVLWARHDLLLADAALAPLVAGLEPGDATIDGGGFVSGEADLDPALAVAQAPRVPQVHLPTGAEVLLRAGDVPVVVALPAGSGWVVVELIDLAGHAEFAARGTTPLWVRRVTRRLTARLAQPRLWQAGAPAPMDARLRRSGAAVDVIADAALMAAPGVWQRELDGGETEPVIVVASAAEGRLERRTAPGHAHDAVTALPTPRGADWGLPLLIAAVVVLLIEGALAAWAGKTYGR